MQQIKWSAVILMGIFAYNAGAFQFEDNNAPTVVYGAAATPDGGQNVFVVEQPKDAQNPLGNPIVGKVEPTKNFDEPQTVAKSADVDAQPQNGAAVRNMLKNGNPPAEAQALGKDFQNTLMEANGMVYDVQAYPEQDLKLMSNPADPMTIYSPNVNN